MFNLSQTSNSGSVEHDMYTVDKNGKIDVPVLGQLSVEGMTRLDVAQMIKYRLA